MLRPLLFSALLSALTLYVYHIYHPPTALLQFIASPMRPPWSSALAGWHSRASPYPNPHAFEPKREQLNLAVLRNAQVETEGFTLALFEGGIAVDHHGKVLNLVAEDYDGLLDLARATPELPPTGGFRNTWVIDQLRTGQPIDRILLPISTLSNNPKGAYEQEFKETSVQGFDKTKVALKTPVDGNTELPTILWELTGLVLEAREGDAENDEAVLARVRAILGNVF